MPWSVMWPFNLPWRRWSMHSLLHAWTIATQFTPDDTLQRVLNAAARLVTNTHKYDRGLSSLLHWLIIPERIEYKFAVMVRLCLENKASTYLSDQGWVVLYRMVKKGANFTTALNHHPNGSHDVIGYVTSRHRACWIGMLKTDNLLSGYPFIG